MRQVVVIPARAGSARFANKPLAILRGQSLILRAWRIATAVPGVSQVVVATDDAAIDAHVRGFGGEVVRTDPALANGTLRAAAVAHALRPQPDAVVNLQGDAVLTPPGAVAAAFAGLEQLANPATPNLGQVQAATVAVPLDGAGYAQYLAAKKSGRASGTTVVRNQLGDALYFSKLTLPHLRHPPKGGPLAWRHLGLYAYRAAALQRYAALPATPLELTEGLEQLRWLEHGLAMRVVPYSLAGRSVWSIDYAEDLQRASDIIAAEGELLCD